MKDQPPNCTATSSSSSSAATRKSSLSAECERCVSYLTRALDRTGSKQQALLRAMGVVLQRSNTSSDGGDEGEKKIYRRSKDGRGILVQLRSSSSTTTMSVSSESSENHSSDAVVEAVRRRTKSNIIKETQQQNTIDNDGNDTTTTLRNRLTKAASHLVEGIRHSADDIINNTNHDGVLSTSPNDGGNQINQRKDTTNNKRTLTTIAIECQQCGSDTRAEAGARAYVKGPDPLSIILCSNRLASQREVNEVLTHELIHIYDIQQKHMDLTNCQQLAYSEIRAAREAECGNSLTKSLQRICSKDKATVATKNMFPEEGRGCVCSVFDEAVNDYMPFGVSQGKRSAPHRASDR